MFKRLMKLHLLMVGVVLTAVCSDNAELAHVTRVSSGADIFLRSDSRLIKGVVPRRATLAGIFNEHELEGGLATRVIEAVRPVFDPRRIRAGNAYQLVFAADGSLRRFEYHVDNDQFLQVRNRTETASTFDAELVPYVKERIEISMRGFIDPEHTSLVGALNGGGENVMLGIKMAEVFSGEIDFNNELRLGDRFDVLFEKYFRDGEFAGYGDVVAAEFVNKGRRVQAFRFTVPGDDEALYYDDQGRSLKRLFLRSPFRFEPRVTSRFSYRRLHPVLGVHRPHLGVDYGAPTGTPVIAVATGQVVSAGRSSGSGNMVRLRHTNGYETYYLHLSAFAEGVRSGTRVVQGQVIGRVGATGLATGPHLDYRMRKHGKFVNPLLEHRKLPPGDPVPEQYLEVFYATRDQTLEQMLSATASLSKTGALAQ